jgi:hypothetical protein
MWASAEAAGDEKMMNRIRRIRGQVKGMDEDTRKAVGKYATMFKKRAGSPEDILKELTKLGETGGGEFAQIIAGERFAGIQAQMPGGGKVAIEEGAFGGTMVSKDVDKLKKEKTAAEALHKVWTSPGGIAEKFDDGMGKLEKATQSLERAAVELSKRLP